MSDGSQLRQTWYSALNDAETHFRQLLTSPSSEWKRASTTLDASSKQKGKARVSAVPELADVLVHRKATQSGEDVFRLVLDVPTGDEQVSLESWKAVLSTPEIREEWDPAVEEAHLLEMFDRNTRIAKTNYTLGWPANPRDSVTIARSFYDTTTLIDISTSLPRSRDEPAYLRPSPPYVRSHVKLYAWCIQYTQPQPASPNDPKKPAIGGKLRITCFWQHDLKALWGLGSSTSNLLQQLSTMMLSLLKTVIKRGDRVPKIAGYGNGVSIERVRYQIDREALTVDYAIIPDDDVPSELGLQGMDEVHALREHRRLTRSIECLLPSLEGWDVQVALKGSSVEVESLPWSAHAMRSSSNPSTSSPPDQILLRLTHSALTNDDAVLKVRLVVEVSGGTRGLRLNGLAKTIHDLEERDPSSLVVPQKILQDVASAVDLSFQTTSSISTAISTASSSSSGQPLSRTLTERTAAAEKSILSKVRRNYIYFSSLLQEPEAKWRRTTEARGVSITQLDSIDPTLVVYRAEATFLGVGLWDLYGAVVSPGARVYWDKQHEDGTLLEDVNELTELWHFKTKPAWPVNGRDSVVLKTVYKSPTTIHVFSFSADDPHLFPHIPPVEPNVIRTQIDLQGWAIEALSPTTTMLTLLEQSDPKGWTNKTSIPTQMISTLAGIGEFAIKCGGPPIVTRLAGSKANDLRYDHERGSFKAEYEPSMSRRATAQALLKAGTSPDASDDSSFPAIECEIRCDIDTWGSSLDIVVDPPPQTITCLRRHRLSAEGGGLWITLTHDSIFVDDERLLALVRRAPGKERGLVMVNGAKVSVDVEELPEHEIKALSKQKRVKPQRVPLDQPPVMGVIRRRNAELSQAEGEEGSKKADPSTTTTNTSSTATWASAPRISSPLSRIFTYAVDQATTTTQQAVAAISPANVAGGPASVLDPTKMPMQYALEALAWTQAFNSKGQTTSTNLQDGWTLVSDKGVSVHRQLMPEISPIIPVHKGFKVIEGVSAEELASVITELGSRKTWDERYDSAHVLEAYGAQATTTFHVAKGGFPFRDRGFYLANVVARAHISAPSMSRRNTGDVAEQSPTARNAIFCVSASFSQQSATASAFSPAKYNSYVLPIGRVYLDAWILETLDPYTKENYAIPSSRCTRLVAVDYAGSIPAAFNSMINATLARGVEAVEAHMKNIAGRGSSPMMRLPAPGFVVSERKQEEHGAGAATDVVGAAPFMAWKLRKRDENRTLVETRYEVEQKVYRAVVLVAIPARHGPSGTNQQPGGVKDASTSSHTRNASHNGENTPRSSRLMLSSSPHSRHRHPSDQSIPETSLDSSSSDSTITNSTILTISSPTPSSPPAVTPGLPMPGSMVASPTFSSTSPPLPTSPPPRLRQRAVSSGAGSPQSISNTNTTARYHADGFTTRGRTTSSAFTLKGEVKLSTDLVVAELVVDSKIFRVDGKEARYSVHVHARKRKGKVSLGRTSILAANIAVANSATGTVDSSASPSFPSASSTPVAGHPEDDLVGLPFVYTIHTMPSSPLHSSGMNAEAPSRHLLRLTLPTAQYQISTVKDPLTGETQSAPPKPAWMEELEKEEGGVLVEIIVQPDSAASAKEVPGQDKSSKQWLNADLVLVNGKEVKVVSEKESLTSLGREELLDDRMGRMGVLSRIPNESEPLPQELKIPIGIAEDLLQPPETVGETTPSSLQTQVEEKGAVIEHGEDSPKTPKLEVSATEPPHVVHAASSGPGGLLGFLQAYPNPLMRFTGSSSSTNIASAPSKPIEGSSSVTECVPPGGLEAISSDADSVKGNGRPDAGISTSGAQVVQQRGGKQYPLSTLVLVGLIAFLIGSLLRSLLSPADFIYVVTDLREAEEANTVVGWREIRRLLELKYVIGGWDFQVAVVRRHLTIAG